MVENFEDILFQNLSHRKILSNYVETSHEIAIYFSFVKKTFKDDLTINFKVGRVTRNDPKQNYDCKKLFFLIQSIKYRRKTYKLECFYTL